MCTFLIWEISGPITVCANDNEVVTLIIGLFDIGPIALICINNAMYCFLMRCLYIFLFRIAVLFFTLPCSCNDERNGTDLNK